MFNYVQMIEQRGCPERQDGILLLGLLPLLPFVNFRSLQFSFFTSPGPVSEFYAFSGGLL
jgi:hypothetical protein